MRTANRLIVLPSITLIVAIGLVIHMAGLQFAPMPVMPSNDQDMLQDKILPAFRGAIVDRHGEVLASSLPQLSLLVEPAKINTTSDAFIKLAKLINERPSSLRATVRKAKGTKGKDTRDELVLLKRQLPLSIADSIRVLKIDGLHLQFEYRRLYLEAATTAHILGVTDESGKALGGVEQSLNSQLSGVPGVKKVLRDEFGNPRHALGEIIAPKSGNSLQLAIDLRLQNWAYRELQKGIRETKAKSASILMVNAASGEIMALVNVPSFDPNSAVALTKSARNNRIATDAIHPGEAITPILLAAALDSKLIDGGKISRMSPAELVAAMNPEYLRNTMQRLGFGTKTRVHLTNEVAGHLPQATTITKLLLVDAAKNNDLLLATPLQLARAYTVFARQGELTDLRMLKRGTTMAKAINTRKPRVLDRQTTAQLMAMMRIRKQRNEAATPPQQQLIQFLGWGGDIAEDRKRGFLGIGTNRYGRVYIGMAPLDKPLVIGVVVLRDIIAKRGQNAKNKAQINPAEAIFVSTASTALHLLGVPPQLKQSSEASGISLGASPPIDELDPISASNPHAHQQGSLL